MDALQETLNRLEDQIGWYDKKSSWNQQWYKRSRIIVIVAAALIPISVNFLYGKLVSAALGVLIVVVEGIQQLNQFHQNWITYRSTCEALKHEKYLWIGKAGHYADTDTPDALLAERIESIIAQEHSKWVNVREQAGKKSSVGTKS